LGVFAGLIIFVFLFLFFFSLLIDSLPVSTTEKEAAAELLTRYSDTLLIH